MSKQASGQVPGGSVFMWTVSDEEFVFSLQKPNNSLPTRVIVPMSRWDWYVERWNLLVREHPAVDH
jgi:hypothetical protein